MPCKLENAPGWQLAELGKPGKGNGHWLQPVDANTLPFTEDELREVRKTLEMGLIEISDDED